MYELELFVLGMSAFFTYCYLKNWFGSLRHLCLPARNHSVIYVMGSLPVVSLILMVLTLRLLASFDVVDSLFYILFYILLGYAWLYAGLSLLFPLFDLSWKDDALYGNNRAALLAVSGAFLGLTVIYCGANVGDGPGWWCVIFAGLPGVAAWIILVRVVNAVTHVLERITIGRDLECSVRFGCYLIAAGLILARACAGDWTSFYRTIVEFLDGWPVLLLTVLAILTERIYMRKPAAEHSRLLSSLVCGVMFIAVAVFSILLLPSLNENPFYRTMSGVSR